MCNYFYVRGGFLFLFKGRKKNSIFFLKGIERKKLEQARLARPIEWTNTANESLSHGTESFPPRRLHYYEKNFLFRKGKRERKKRKRDEKRKKEKERKKERKKGNKTERKQGRKKERREKERRIGGCGRQASKRC